MRQQSNTSTRKTRGISGLFQAQMRRKVNSPVLHVVYHIERQPAFVSPLRTRCMCRRKCAFCVVALNGQKTHTTPFNYFFERTSLLDRIGFAFDQTGLKIIPEPIDLPGANARFICWVEKRASHPPALSDCGSAHTRNSAQGD